MKCTVVSCGGNTKVLETRTGEDGANRRRRQCMKCDRRFTTKETTVQQGSMSVRCEMEITGGKGYFDEPVFRAVSDR